MRKAVLLAARERELRIYQYKVLYDLKRHANSIFKDRTKKSEFCNLIDELYKMMDTQKQEITDEVDELIESGKNKYKYSEN